MVFDDNVMTYANMKEEDKFRKEIRDLVEEYKWKLENSEDDLSFEDPSCVILVVTIHDVINNTV